MPVTIESTRFGALEIPDDAVLEFPDGLIGLGGTRYALIARDGGGPVPVAALASTTRRWRSR